VLRRLLRPATRASGEVQGGAVWWLLAVTAALMLLIGWLLPWFLEPVSGGIGFSAQDAVVSSPTGIGTILVYVLAVTMLVLVLSPLGELVARFRKRKLGPRLDRLRFAAAIIGLALTVLVWVLVGLLREEPLFGSLSSHAFTSSAVWLTMYGYGVAAVVYGARAWVLTHPNLTFGAAALPFGALLPLMFHQAPDFVLWGAQDLAIYMLLALGLNVVVGFAGLLDLGYAAFFAIGAYMCASLASPAHHLHLPLWALLFIGAMVAALFGAVLGAPTLRLRGDYLAIVTLGFGEIIPDLATNDIGGLTGGPNGISAIDQPVLGRINFATNPQWFYWSLLIVVLLVIVLLRNIEHSRMGRAWVALREDEVAAAATGINTTSTKLLAFAIGASVSGFAGAFYGSMLTAITPEAFLFQVSITVLSIIVLGGIGNIVGVIVGSFVLTFVIYWVLQNFNEWSVTLGHTINVSALANVDFRQYTYVIYGVALIAMMLFRPGGLLPSRARRVELETGIESESLAAVQGKA
jgi:branched-chain amino acid transport system permease protein